jgi:tetratricopeptide (TPR) repeat protein
MIKFFRKIRKKLLIENNTSKYFKYAIGEIVLVVIGILIALQINNWNENRNKINQLDTIYKIVEENLKTDYFASSYAIKSYNELDNRLKNILTKTYSLSFLDSINASNYADCVFCKSNINIYFPFFAQDNGIELLKTFEDNAENKSNKLSQEIIQFYKYHSQAVAETFKYVQQESYSNLKYFEQFSWYSDYSLNIYNAQAVAFFLNDQTYKNKAANFKVFAIRNYLSRIKNYNNRALYLINQLESRRLKSLKKLAEKGVSVDEIIVVINQQDRENPKYHISEYQINELSYYFIKTKKQNKEALKLLELNIAIHPDAFNTYDSYGQCLLLLGDTKNAIKAYKKSLELNPENENAIKVLSELNKESK